VWVEDEHRYGLISVTRRYWTLKGQRPTVPYQTKFEWGYVYGALDVVTGRAEFLYTPTVSLPWTAAYLKELIATDPEAIHIIMWDRAGFHPKQDSLELPASVRVLPLPPYSPELNPIESLWDPVKRRIANDVWETLENIEAAISEVLELFWQQAEQVQSLLGDSWLTRGVATFLDRRKRLISF
jgi:putative transposase